MPEKPPMLKRFVQCIGLASLILVMNYGGLLGGGANVRMHVPFALGGIVAANIADIFLLGAGIFLLYALLLRTPWWGWARLLLAMALPPYLLERTRLLYPFVVRDDLVPVLAVLWAALLLLLFVKFAHRYRQLLRTVDLFGTFFAIFALFSLVQLLWVARWKPPPHQHLAAWETTPQPPRQHPRLVWIVFDELSYDQLFEHRALDLQLPNFDALRSESTLFTDVQPVGYHTAKVIPSLLSGHPVDDFHYRFDNRFLVHYRDEHGWHSLNGGNTLFGDAQRNGWRTAAVGWYNPYCGIYGDAIGDCYWMNLDKMDGLMAQRRSVWRNTYAPLRQIVRQLGSTERAAQASCDFDVQRRLETHLDLQKHALQLLKTDQADFVFLHLPIPHSPNIWSRMDARYTQKCGSSYLDNLALSDRVLGQILSSLQASPRWKDTTLIVEGDHGWRIDLWNWLPSWTDEDEAASRGEFDPRPALLVHQAGQTQPQVNASAWPLVRIHEVIKQVLSGQAVHF